MHWKQCMTLRQFCLILILLLVHHRGEAIGNIYDDSFREMFHSESDLEQLMDHFDVHEIEEFVKKKNITCPSSKSIADAYNIKNALSSSESDLLAICPALFIRVVTESDCELSGHEHDSSDEVSIDAEESQGTHSYLYGTLAVLACSLLSLLGIPLVLCDRNSASMQILLQFFIGLAVSSMACDAILHLWPMATGLHTPHTAAAAADVDDGHNHGVSAEGEEEHDRTYLWRSVAVVGALYLFFIFETLMHQSIDHRHTHSLASEEVDARRRDRKTHHHHHHDGHNHDHHHRHSRHSHASVLSSAPSQQHHSPNCKNRDASLIQQTHLDGSDQGAHGSKSLDERQPPPLHQMNKMNGSLSPITEQKQKCAQDQDLEDNIRSQHEQSMLLNSDVRSEHDNTSIAPATPQVITSFKFKLQQLNESSPPAHAESTNAVDFTSTVLGGVDSSNSRDDGGGGCCAGCPADGVGFIGRGGGEIAVANGATEMCCNGNGSGDDHTAAAVSINNCAISKNQSCSNHLHSKSSSSIILTSCKDRERKGSNECTAQMNDPIGDHAAVLPAPQHITISPLAVSVHCNNNHPEEMVALNAMSTLELKAADVGDNRNSVGFLPETTQSRGKSKRDSEFRASLRHMENIGFKTKLRFGIPEEKFPLVMMIMFGDMFHNLTDGLAVGAAFGASASSGLATSIAVLFHELPHELGDFAILYDCGINVRRIILLNAISSLAAFVGLYIGLVLSAYDGSYEWIFAITAGMFLYVAFIDMLPQMMHVNTNSPWIVYGVQNCGLVVGFTIMLMLAVYESH